MSGTTFYISRDAQGQIATISRTAFDGSESLPQDAPEIAAFLGKDASFSTSDAEFVRVLEDLIDTLISKNIIRHTDLPLAAQRKINTRKGMRSGLKGALRLFRQDDPLL